MWRPSAPRLAVVVAALLISIPIWHPLAGGRVRSSPDLERRSAEPRAAVGIEDVRFHDTPALLSSPRSASVEIQTPITRRLKLREDPVPGDEQSHTYADPSQIPYDAHAATGGAP